jgi:hypothetical protein
MEWYYFKKQRTANNVDIILDIVYIGEQIMPNVTFEEIDKIAS